LALKVGAKDSNTVGRLVSGDAALATALNASLTANIVPKAAAPPVNRKSKR
jgi:hypothetical protein